MICVQGCYHHLNNKQWQDWGCNIPYSNGNSKCHLDNFLQNHQEQLLYLVKETLFFVFKNYLSNKKEMSVLLMYWCLLLHFQYICCMLQWLFKAWLDQLFPTAYNGILHLCQSQSAKCNASLPGQFSHLCIMHSLPIESQTVLLIKILHIPVKCIHK